MHRKPLTLIRRPMLLADEALCVRHATRLPGMFGPLTTDAFFAEYGEPSVAQELRLDKFIEFDRSGCFVSRTR